MDIPTESPVDTVEASSPRIHQDSRHRDIFWVRTICSSPDSRCRTITSSPDEDEDDQESRLLEAHAREELEGDGCPACYPPELNIPYWQSFSSTGDVVLCAQREDWRKSRAFQQSFRNRFQHNSFGMFVASVCERQRRNGLGSHVQLLLDPQQQSQQQTWIEFQDYHLACYGQFRKKRDRLEKLRDSQKQAGATDLEGSGHSARSGKSIQGRLEFAERTLRSHEILPGWIEQQQLMVDSWPSSLCQGD
ncbi:hypothetical protein M406DRAFT_74146 [Cryphonectria parasitica EP155]|uniref:Uncharacterized protein n=1 Tax=Cryphonectria parasitica (strain ATCC 38755 / EP155) TaxID=660469 RepID=A0A9P4XYC2_CRYP1|nr:uncharacterized protein M406DRAFT_74146 [Cryphonectria parasitica EP155]KAF3763554.1 hypothetical protein M406DRAFT_74146 [Cryphonectria parasitica EP155]